MISTLSTERSLLGINTFPRESRVFDRSATEQCPQLDYEHISVTNKTKQNQTKGLSRLVEMWFVIPRAVTKIRLFAEGGLNSTFLPQPSL